MELVKLLLGSLISHWKRQTVPFEAAQWKTTEKSLTFNNAPRFTGNRPEPQVDDIAWKIVNKYY